MVKKKGTRPDLIPRFFFVPYPIWRFLHFSFCPTLEDSGNMQTISRFLFRRLSLQTSCVTCSAINKTPPVRGILFIYKNKYGIYKESA
jgi:hypothetical protein